MDIATHYISQAEYDAIPKFPAKEYAEDGGMSKYIYPADNGKQEFIKRPGQDPVLVEIREDAETVTPEPKPVHPAKAAAAKRNRLIREYGVASLEVRYNVEFEKGATRAQKRNYVMALKKVINKGIKPETPEYWAILNKYGWSKKKVK